MIGVDEPIRRERIPCKIPSVSVRREVVRRRMSLLGATFEFNSNSERFMRLVDDAYAGLPAQRLSRNSPVIRLSIQLRNEGKLAASREPPQLRTQGGAGLLCGTIDAGNFAALSPATRSGLIAVSRGMLRFPYHARYELLEFAVFTLASRVRGLVPLHGACVGSKGRGLLLIGDSGAGKSTLMLQCMLQGLELLAEDAVFVDPGKLLATGVGNFLHLRRDSLRFVHDPGIARRIRKARIIRRRSGVEKFEIDMRQPGFRIARAPVEMAGVVFVSARRPGAGRCSRRSMGAQRWRGSRLLSNTRPACRAGQGSPTGWVESAHSSCVVAADPAEAAQALRGLIAWGQKAR